MRVARSIRWAAGASLLALTPACAVPMKQAIHLEPSFQPVSVAEIRVLPVVDARVDKQQKTDIEKHVRGAALKNLQKKGYKALTTNELGPAGAIDEEQLKASDAAWIKQLGPAEARFVMVLAVLDIKTRLTFGSTGNAEVTGVLYDKDAGVALWRDKGIGQAGQGGLAGMLVKGAMDETAVGAAMYNLLSSLPAKIVKK
jgi:hypothetical protein